MKKEATMSEEGSFISEEDFANQAKENVRLEVPKHKKNDSEKPPLTSS